MSEDDFNVGDLTWDELGRINQDGYVDDPSLEDSPVIFEDQFEMRSRELQRQPNDTKPVIIIPAKQGAWSRNPQLGIEQSFAALANNEQTILKCDEWGFPQVWSVMLGIDSSDVSGGGQSGFQVTAKIFAGSGGATQEFEVDWIEGTTFSCVMNAINIVAIFDDFTDVPEDIRLVATIGRGRLTGSMPTRTVPRIAVPSTEVRRFRIPKFARYVTIAGAGGFGPPGPYDPDNNYFFSPTDSGIRNITTGTELLALGGRLAVPGTARYFGLQNREVNPAEPDHVFDAIFELAL